MAILFLENYVAFTNNLVVILKKHLRGLLAEGTEEMMKGQRRGALNLNGALDDKKITAWKEQPQDSHFKLPILLSTDFIPKIHRKLHLNSTHRAFDLKVGILATINQLENRHEHEERRSERERERSSEPGT